MLFPAHVSKKRERTEIGGGAGQGRDEDRCLTSLTSSHRQIVVVAVRVKRPVDWNPPKFSGNVGGCQAPDSGFREIFRATTRPTRLTPSQKCMPNASPNCGPIATIYRTTALGPLSRAVVTG